MLKNPTIPHHNSGYFFRCEQMNFSQDGIVQTRHVISLYNPLGIPVLITPIAEQLSFTMSLDGEYSSWRANEIHLWGVTHFLNWLLEAGILDLKLVTQEHISQYLKSYADTKLTSGKFPSRQSVRTRSIAVAHFGVLLAKEYHANIAPANLLKPVPVSTNNRSKVVDTCRIVPTCKDETYEIIQLYRDMPRNILPHFVAAARLHDPELEFAIILCARMGLRTGEVANLRDKTDPRGPGIRYQMECGEPVSFEVDLRAEYRMRSDDTYVGGIKRHNFRVCYPYYVKEVFDAYKRHLLLITDKPHEDGITPLFLNLNRSNGVYKTVTAASLRSRINRLFWKWVLPALEKDPDPHCQRFFHIMKNRTWGPHAFRHYHAVDLVVTFHVSAAELKGYRGDKSITSAEHYLEHKEIFRGFYIRSSEHLGSMITNGTTAHLLPSMNKGE